jgi:protein-disulfide isomerase
MSHRRMLYQFTVAAVAIIAVAFITAGAGRGVADSPMQDLSNSDQLKQRLQQDFGKVKLIALVSPICPACRRGFADMQSVLKNVPDDRLRAYIVWLPMFPGDSRSWAQTRSHEFSDPRVTFYWDGGRLT